MLCNARQVCVSEIPMCLNVLKTRTSPNINAVRCMQTSSINNKNVQAGKHKPTTRRDKPLTYEQAMFPYRIGHEKNWLSWNTSNLLEGLRRPEMVQEDIVIRKFIFGTWHKLFLSEIIIKRRGNMIFIGGIVLQAIHPRKMYFLIGYTEELLSYLLKCPVKMEIQTLPDKKDIVFKYI